MTAPPRSQPVSRDALLIDPEIVGISMRAAKEIARAERLDNVSAKEVYRTVIEAVITGRLSAPAQCGVLTPDAIEAGAQGMVAYMASIEPDTTTKWADSTEEMREEAYAYARACLSAALSSPDDTDLQSAHKRIQELQGELDRKSEALEHARARFECLAEDFKAADDTTSWAMCNVDAGRMFRALALPSADRGGK